MQTQEIQVVATVLPDRTIELSFPYDIEIVDKVKSVPGRRYDPERRVWSVPDTPQCRALLMELFGESLKRENARKTTEPQTGGNGPVCQAYSSGPALERLTKELHVRNYSGRTVNNYRDCAALYLAWLGQAPAENNTDRIRDYLLHLHETRGFSARTVNLHAAAVDFLYSSHNIDIRESGRIRMKEEKTLPKVYS